MKIRDREFLGAFYRFECGLQHDKQAAPIFIDVAGEVVTEQKLRIGDIRYIQFSKHGVRAYPTLSPNGTKAIAA